MAATAVLRSHDVLRSPNPFRFRETLNLTLRNPRRNPNVQISNNPNPAVKSRRRKRSPTKSPPVKPNDGRRTAVTPAKKDLVMGQVKILKRGEPLDFDPAKSPGPQPGSGSEMVNNEVRVDRDSGSQLVKNKVRVDRNLRSEMVKNKGWVDRNLRSEMVKNKGQVDRNLRSKMVKNKVRFNGNLGSEMVKNKVRDDGNLGSEMVNKEIMVDGVYAGAGIYVSPPPSSLPLPSFLRGNGSATTDLMRLLRLD